MSINRISLDSTSSGETTYACVGKKYRCEVKIVKDLSHKIDLFYKENNSGFFSWTININDHSLMMGNETLSYSGSKEFIFTPVDEKRIKIQETNQEDKTSSRWVDLSPKGYQAFETLALLKVQTLIDIGKFLYPLKGKKVKTILYSEKVGVLLHIKNAKETGIYYGEEYSFEKCEAKLSSDERWEVTLPMETSPHTLALPKQDLVEDEYVLLSNTDASWDGIPLASIILEEDG